MSDIVCDKADRENSKYSSITPVSPIRSPAGLFTATLYACMLVNKSPSALFALETFCFSSSYVPHISYCHISDNQLRGAGITALNVNKQPRDTNGGNAWK